MEQAAAMLLAAREGAPIKELPIALRPQGMEEAYLIQDLMATGGDVCGWKVGGPASKTPLFAPMSLAGFHQSESLFALPYQRLRGVESEIAFLMGQNLPPRSFRYTKKEVVEAISSCHPAIEILEAAFVEPDAVDPLSMIADVQSHSGFVAGPSFANWQTFDFADEDVTLEIDGIVRAQAKASNPAGTDLLRLVVWLANHGSQRTGGLREGQWITTGNWTGKLRAPAGSSVTVKFTHAGVVSIRFAEAISYERSSLANGPHEGSIE
ncbi:MAG TPA: hypothetical protein VHX49_15010 [Candidatus Acidoferrales bacterium]|jgi:2-keto-4-pentenoate hydratase|nr:hypothetical protein [Candidatus Acidoferrales bacterium]